MLVDTGRAIELPSSSITSAAPPDGEAAEIESVPFASAFATYL